MAIAYAPCIPRATAKLILHLNGNVGQWLVASLNRLDDVRDRPAEFNAQGGISAAALLARVGTTMQQASEVLFRLTEASSAKASVSDGEADQRALTALDRFHLRFRFNLAYAEAPPQISSWAPQD